MRGSMFRLLPLAALLVAGVARAQAQPAGEQLPAVEPATRPTGYTFDGVARPITTKRDFAMELNFRGRVVSIPRSVMDNWYYDADSADWAYIEGRPKVWGYGLGLELVVKNDVSNGLFYAEFIDSEMKPGYWDDLDDPDPIDHLDGKYIDPSPGVGILAVGANYAYEAHLVRTSDTGGRFGLSVLAGGGVGLGVLTGVIEQWGPDDDGNPGYKRYLDGLPSDENTAMPRVYPMVDVNAALRFNFGDRLVIRTEGGLHTMLYYGATAGVMF